MEIIRNLKEQNSLVSSVLTIGSYDGIHRGHHDILSAVVNHAHAREIPSVLVTFDPHPRHVLDSNSDKLSLIMSLEQKLDIICSLGIDLDYIIDFTEAFSKTTATDFLEQTILPYFKPEYLIVGYANSILSSFANASNAPSHISCDEALLFLGLQRYLTVNKIPLSSIFV